MINISDLLFSICENEKVYDKNFDLIESGLLDSFGFIELLSKLEDEGIIIHPTRIDINCFRTPQNIENLINDLIKK